MDDEDWTTFALVILIVGAIGLVGWVLIELGVYLHGLNGW
jgi:hypothetical protein